MSVGIVAARYAKSLIELAKEKNVLDAVHQDMQLFLQTAAANRGLMLALKSPVVRHEKKLGILKALFETRVNPVSYAIFSIITKKNREAILDGIAEEFVRSYNALQGIQRASVTTTVPLNDNLREKITAIIKQATGKTKVDLVEKVDPKLIGGYLLRVGDRQIDASLRSRLSELKLQMAN